MNFVQRGAVSVGVRSDGIESCVMSEPTFPVLVREMRYEAIDVLSVALEALDRAPLPAVEPGAHVDVFLPNGISRSYSLSNVQKDNLSYRLTIAKDANSRGGSRFIHDQLRVGDILQISTPRNNFPLTESAAFSIFIAGGIGITPFVPMVRRLNERNAAWRLHYCVRTRERAALIDEIVTCAAEGKGEAVPNYDEEPGGRMLDIERVLRDAPSGAHIYCCGPIGMLNAYRAAAEALRLEQSHVHFEYFSSDVQAALQGGFTVVCSRSGKSVFVEQGQTILEALASVSIDVPSSCQEGVCGSCEVRVLSGAPDHRDMILSKDERESGKTMMVCCSGSKTETLVLDI